jgi:hypothetical protein
MRGRAISPSRSLLWGIIFYESEASATRRTQQPVVWGSLLLIFTAMFY